MDYPVALLTPQRLGSNPAVPVAMNPRALVRILDFFIPLEVLSSVLMVFVAENILDSLVGSIGLYGWLTIYLVGVLVVSGLRYVSADDDELDELEDDLEDL